jgi:putative salt-induced outer membrane protein YdiY
MKFLFIVLSLFVLGSKTIAETIEKPTTIDVELGFIATSGNTETTTLKGRVNVKQNLQKFRNNYIAEAFYKEDEVNTDIDGQTRKETQTTAEKYFFSAQSDLKIDSEYRAIFFFGSYEQDEFSGFEYQTSVAAGYSDRLFSSDRSYLSNTVGPGIAHTRDRETGDTTSTGILRVAIEHFIQISDSAKFLQALSSEIPFEKEKNQKSRYEASLTTNIIKGIALKVSLIVDHNTKVPEGTEKADTQTAVTFVYSF